MGWIKYQQEKVAMKKSLIFLPIFLLVLTVFSIINNGNVSATLIDSVCTEVETIFARGSGGQLNSSDGEAKKYFDSIQDRLKNSSLTRNEYELGTEPYGGYRYPAIDVGGWSFGNAIGAVFSAGDSFAYGDSVKQGIGELNSYLTQRHNKCKASDTKYILGGYSQGAQVVGQALPGISQEIRDQIVFVGLFGDPKLHYPEGEGWNPPACQGKDLSLWRRAASSCHLDNGALGARKPYLPDDMKQKTGLWCYEKDSICDLGAGGAMDGHSQYKGDGRAIDEAAREAAEKLAVTLSPQSAANINTKHEPGSGTTGINTVFLIDTTGSMKGIIEQTKQFARESADKIRAQNGRVALVEYRDAGDDFTSRILSDFDDDFSVFQSRLDSLIADQGGDAPEAALHALMTAFNGLSWTNGATKAAIVITDTTYHEPDPVDGTTVGMVAQRALEIDPVNIYPVVPPNLAQSGKYRGLSETTSGQIIVNNGDTAAALNTAITKIQERPVPILKNLEYIAEPYQEIFFDASDSYVVDANITKYHWDFNGDGDFETTTTTPYASKIYYEPQTGHMQVKVSADNNTIATMSAAITIRHKESAPTLPAKPANLAYTITSTTNNKSAIKLNWGTDNLANKWLIQINDIAAGHINGTRTSLELTDIDRSKDVVITIAGATNDFTKGDASSVTIPALSPQANTPPVLSTCTQSNIFIRIICKALAIIKVVIGGIVHFLLPWAI